MRALVVYESLYGNTHAVAEAIGRGLEGRIPEVSVRSVSEAPPDVVAGVDLVVVGGPTHVHGMATDRSRAMGVQRAEDDDDLHLEPHADGPGLRGWFDALPPGAGRWAAAFDTRLDRPPIVTGRASKAIARRLRHHRYEVLDGPMSFFVGSDEHLVAGDVERAEAWGRELASLVVPART